jgi:predicted nucleic acid-binding protein
VLLVDTNVLLEATDEARKQHREARRLVESHPALALAAQVIREYLVVATRPISANGLGLSTPDALENVREFRRGIRLLPEERPILPAFLALVEHTSCAGKRIHDVHLVATARVHRVQAIVSLNAADLAPLADELPVLTPHEVLRGPRSRKSARGQARRGRSSPKGRLPPG